MIAITLMAKYTETKYGCNESYDSDQLCLQFWSKTTLYTCNVDSKGDLILLQYQFKMK